MANFYEILGLEQNSRHSSQSSENVKNAYHKALLKYHPDRVVSGNSSSARPAVTVDEITQAYKTLSDSKAKAEYDRRLVQAGSPGPGGQDVRIHHTGLETVDLDSLAFDEQTQIWSRSCRCGDRKGFIVSEAELEKHVEDGELMVGCKGCSLWLRVLFGVEDAG